LLRVIAKKVFIGAVKGVLTYVVFLVLLPMLFSKVLGIPVEVDRGLGVLMLGLFTSLGVASSVTKPFIGIPLSALSTIVALYILVAIGKEVSEASKYIEIPLSVSLDITPLLILVAGFTVLNAVIEFFEKLVAQEE